MKPAYKSTFSF